MHGAGQSLSALALLIGSTFTEMQRSLLNFNQPQDEAAWAPFVLLAFGLNGHNLMFYRTRPSFTAGWRSKGDLQVHTCSFATLSALCSGLRNIKTSSRSHFYQFRRMQLSSRKAHTSRKKGQETITAESYRDPSEGKVLLFVLLSLTFFPF